MGNIKKIAYLILTHTDPTHLERLIGSLNYNSDFYVHLDKKLDMNVFLSKCNLKKSNINFINDRDSINWAGFNMVLATKCLMKSAIESKQEYSHLVLISGLDYPLISKERIYEYFIKNKDVEFIRSFSITQSNCKHCKEKIERYWLNDFKYFNNNLLNKIVRKGILTLSIFKKKNDSIIINDKSVDICFGSQWWAITPKCAKYILEYTFNNNEIDEYFKYAFAPDELYFHTIIFNSEFKSRTLNKGIEKYKPIWEWNNIHYLDGSMLGCDTKTSIHSKIKNIKKENKNSTTFYDEKDLEHIISSNQIFVRKVNTQYSTKLLNSIDNFKNNFK